MCVPALVQQPKRKRCSRTSTFQCTNQKSSRDQNATLKTPVARRLHHRRSRTRLCRIHPARKNPDFQARQRRNRDTCTRAESTCGTRLATCIRSVSLTRVTASYTRQVKILILKLMSMCPLSNHSTGTPTRKLVIDFFSVQSQSTVNVWRGTHECETYQCSHKDNDHSFTSRYAKL